MPQPPVTKPLGSPFIELQSVDSTNNYAREQIQAGRQDSTLHGMAIFSHEQVAGKGQRGKTWTSQKGANLLLSIVLKPEPLLLTEQFHLSACAVVAVRDFFAKYAGEDAKIKWPNDLYWQDRKAGGILIESIVKSREPGEPGAGSPEPEAKNVIASLRSQWEWSIIGIGININQTNFPAELPNPVSLKQITGKDFNTIVLAKELCGVLNEKFNQLIKNGFDDIYAQYIQHLYKRNETIKLKKDNRVFEAVIKSVSATGKLIVQPSIGDHPIASGYDFGEVEWLIA